ncbi:GNAT family N-acetyltransferase [Algicella marina]|uniref:GNAT family N-acetyltransferase n=1 Tax=Algicella marina TaxID=2683284 RepID=A0A6P1SYS3_9RHOB|nr:GNAT family N-acetyltransferase [Algicella marina]QHQ34887.1 GNAT family N-acetyltransferase [Algicella marina]
MPADDDTEYELRELRPGDKVGSISMGCEIYIPLKTFLKNHAKKYQEQYLAKTYVIRKDNQDVVIAYVTLVCGEIVHELDENELDGAQFTHKQYPALKLARLAIDRRYRGCGLGRNLVDFSVGRARHIAKAAGCRFVVVDAKKPSVEFYEKCGFRLIDTPANIQRNEPVMFFDLKKT